MQTKESKTLVIIFRVCIFAAFFTGLMYLIKIVGASNGGSRESAFAAVIGFFYAYVVFTLISFVLSVVCFKTTSAVSSVVRTISLGVTSLILFLNMSFIGLMRDALKARSGDYDQLMELNSKVLKVANDSAAMYKTLLSFASVFLMLILAITSVVALVKTLKGKA